MASKVSSSLLFSFTFLLLILLSIPSHAEKKSPSSQRVIFLKDLQGARKGVKLQGLYQLKKYLNKFGYLNLSPTTKDDDFDDTLEVALKTYQQNYHLKPTGSLDAETVSMMMKPRCGMPDIVNGTTRMQAGEKSHYHGPKSFITVSHFAIQGSKWAKMPVTYKFVTPMSPSVKNAIRQAMSIWTSATNNRLSFAEVNSGEFISIGFYSGDHGDNYPFDGPGRVLAHGFFPQSGGDLHFDASENWSIANPTPLDSIDIESVAVHELGHTLGLGHSRVPGAIMWPTYSGGQAITLSSDDVTGIKYLYGS